MGFPYFGMEFITRVPYSKMELSASFSCYFRGLEISFPAFEIAFSFKIQEIAEITLIAEVKDILEIMRN